MVQAALQFAPAHNGTPGSLQESAILQCIYTYINVYMYIHAHIHTHAHTYPGSHIWMDENTSYNCLGTAAAQKLVGNAHIMMQNKMFSEIKKKCRERWCGNRRGS